jgi:hypothetical protein
MMLSEALYSTYLVLNVVKACRGTSDEARTVRW